MKTYVITLSKVFLKGHPRQGEPTGFEDKLLNALNGTAQEQPKKLHTIRANLGLWVERFSEIEAGRAVLSIRQWTGAPYRSKQREIARLTKEDGIGIQKVIITQSEWEENNEPHYCYWAEIDDKEIDFDAIAPNDGFEKAIDFVEWFIPAINKQKPNKDAWRSLECAIIHFTKFRYR